MGKVEQQHYNLATLWEGFLIYYLLPLWNLKYTRGQKIDSNPFIYMASTEGFELMTC